MILFLMLILAIFFTTLLFLLICLSTLEVEIKKMNNNNNKIKIIAYIRLKLFNTITWIKIKVDNKKIERIKKYNITKKGIDKFNNIKLKILKKENIKYIKKLDIKIKKLDMILKIGAINPIITSFIVTAISIFFSVLVSKKIENYSKEKIMYSIKPIYTEEPNIIINLNCIISVKMVHIINIIYTLLKKVRSGCKYERTSNRRAYAYCNGKHSRYGRC